MSDSIARSEDRRRRELEVATRRTRQALCALDFLTWGEDGHADRCVFGTPCSRDYDLYPDNDSGLVDEKLYEGSAIGALYGVGPIDPYVGELAGWNVIA